MNSAATCHEIENVDNLFVDAFSKAYRSKLQNSNNTFILTHYHGDHYNGLPKDGKYQGPALIHCTPVTAALLEKVHGVASQFIVPHDNGTTWTHYMPNEKVAQVTFYDANHCPGAAIVLIELPDDKTCHLHTGDFRYHEKMKLYPKLQEAVANKKVGVVHLDTTYGHPKHELIPQNVAVDMIASQVETALKKHEQSSQTTLVLLSCYSIGKEKVLWEASKRTNQLVYVSERKHKMLECIQGYQEDESSQILTKCTLDASKSDIHVIPMGMAGELWPFFQPNYKACAEYVEKLDKQYDRVLAFLPTGWAEGTNWNKKNAISKRRMPFQEKDGGVDVEIRLVCYSEHSAFPELCLFVEYLRPRQVVPTVFADANDRRRMEGHFRKFIDTSRAKQHFFKGMMKSNDVKPKVRDADNDEFKVVDVDSPTPKKQKVSDSHDGQVATLVSMGFDSKVAMQSLERCGGNVEAALDALLAKQQQQQQQPSSQEPSPAKTTKGAKSSPTTIKSFFSPKPK